MISNMTLKTVSFEVDTVVWAETDADAKRIATEALLKDELMIFTKVEDLDTYYMPFSWSLASKPLNCPDGNTIGGLLGLDPFESWWKQNHQALRLDPSKKSEFKTMFNVLCHSHA